MSSKKAFVTDVDIDPGWYPGQPELLEDGEEEAQEQEPDQEPESEQEPDHDPGQEPGVATSSKGAVRASGSMRKRSPVSVPTVLTKLQKWGDYASVGSQVLPTKFIPMKTPLSAEILDNWSLPSQPTHRLTVPEVVAQQAALGRKVGLLLDLSNHDCLYTADIPPDLHYTHIKLVAKELPPPEFVDTVVAVVKKFWAANPDEYIAVHCAYGFNRTGFVVCCYLVECCGLTVEEALAAFAESRPPGVKHERFRNELHRRYNLVHGPYAAFGSPDDNSSFGCSPSCASLDLRDISRGPSPMTLTRGATFDCLLGVQQQPGLSPHNSYRRSLDGHRTLTFTTSSVVTEFRRGSNSGGNRTRQQAQQVGEGHWDGNGGGVEGGSSSSGRRPVEETSVSGTTGAAAGSVHKHGSRDGAELSEQQQQQHCYDNESLGVNDRLILASMRQHALAQLSATIPEEAGSAHSTPVRGCSSQSLADCGQATGHSTPRAGQPGKYSHKSLEAIDWGAAAAVDASAEGVEAGGAAGGNRAGPPAQGVADLKLV